MFKTPVLVVALVSGSVLAAPPDVDKSAREGRILIWKEGKHVLLSPGGKTIEELPANAKKYRLLTPGGKTVEIPFPEKSRLTDPSISPDGKRVAFIVLEAPPGIEVPIGRDREFNFLHSVFVSKPDGEGEGHALGLNGQNLTWTPEGKLLVVEAASAKDLYARKFTTWLVDVGTKEKTKLDVPETAQIFCATPDGKSFIASTYDFDKKQCICLARLFSSCTLFNTPSVAENCRVSRTSGSCASLETNAATSKWLRCHAKIPGFSAVGRAKQVLGNFLVGT